ncbi:hypothetical protein [Fusobacterium varium]|uniref:hypothetical protein n=1 Tax=Fusobacterium varium TaxID=856 RepID=UPI000E400684|nr:hypothetical protein [Fusobacterium varium]MCI6032259.1 hypothetical protein [Fusobacterium varium]MDY4005118.1 hypothetical protein [Fusobacterium varium]RGJ27970.1 hypothetical protein DXD66_08510 [Fusobacterium varium]
MKKQLIGLMLIISSFAFAGGDKTFDLLEDQMELKHSYITDGTHKLKINDIDIGVVDGIPFVVIETDSLFTDRAWKEFNKKAYNDVAKDIADEIRAALDTKSEVNISLILDREFGKDMVLSEAQY